MVRTESTVLPQYAKAVRASGTEVASRWSPGQGGDVVGDRREVKIAIHLAGHHQDRVLP